MNNPVILNFNLNVEGSYEGFIRNLRKVLAHHPLHEDYVTQYGEWIREHPLLPVQQPVQPPRWIHINLIAQGEAGEVRTTTIAIRDDNVCFQGFKNQNGQWYEFGINDKKSMRFIDAGSTFLGCDLGYPDLVGGSMELLRLNLTMHDARRVVRTLSSYQQVEPADKDTREDLARVCVMICESARMKPHFDTVNAGWNTHVGSCKICREQAKYTNNWSNMSSDLLSMLEPSPRRTDLLKVVHLVFNKIKYRKQAGQHQQEQAPGGGGGGGGSGKHGPGSSNPQQPDPSSWPPAASQSGSGSGAQEQTEQTGGKSVCTQSLVQVFSVQADLSVVGSIVVYDGKRGQIIYNHGRQSLPKGKYRVYKLALTGPHKAILADGSFTIQFHGITSSGEDASGRPSTAIGEMLWDCYADDVEYDKVLTRDIISRIGTGQQTLAEVKYAVLSEAVEATVEVNLLLPGIAHVYGKITAWHVSLEFEPLVVLFERGPRDDKVELVPSAAGSMVPLELGRSVFAVPLQSRHSYVRIHVYLHVAHPSSEEGDDPLDGGVYFYLDKHTGEIRAEQTHDFLLPVGWTKGSDPAEGSGASRGGQGASGSAIRQGTGQTSSEQQVKVQVNITSPGFHTSPLKPYIRMLRGL